MSAPLLLAALTLAFACGLASPVPLLTLAILARAGMLAFAPPFGTAFDSPLLLGGLAVWVLLDLASGTLGDLGPEWRRFRAARALVAGVAVTGAVTLGMASAPGTTPTALMVLALAACGGLLAVAGESIWTTLVGRVWLTASPWAVLLAMGIAVALVAVALASPVAAMVVAPIALGLGSAAIWQMASLVRRVYGASLRRARARREASRAESIGWGQTRADGGVWVRRRSRDPWDVRR